MRERIIIKQKKNIPLVTIALAASGGSSEEDVLHAGLTGLMARVSIKGTQQRSATDIALLAESMGGSVSPSVGADLFDWEITVPSKHFDRALDLLADVVFNAQFPDHEFEVEKKLALADLEQSRDDMFRFPLRLVLQQAFAGHAYGNSLQTVEGVIASSSPDAVRAWRDEQTASGPWAFVVGDVDPDHVRRRLELLLPPPMSNNSQPAVRPAWPGASSLVESRDKKQTALALAFPGPDRNHPDTHTLQVLANAVGGLGGRFFEELRSKRSLAYTVSLMPVARLLAGTFIAYIATAPEREDEARTALLEQFDLLRNEHLSEDDVERAKRYTIGAWQIRGQTNAAQLSDLMHAHMLGPGASEINDFAAHIEAVTTDDILEVAQKYFDPELRVEGTVRGKNS